MNTREIPHLTDEALADVVENEHAQFGRKALEELVERNGISETAVLLETHDARVEELVA